MKTTKILGKAVLRQSISIIEKSKDNKGGSLSNQTKPDKSCPREANRSAQQFLFDDLYLAKLI